MTKLTLFLLFGQVVLINDDTTLADIVADLQRVADVNHSTRLLAEQAAQDTVIGCFSKLVCLHARGMIADIDEDKLRPSKSSTDKCVATIRRNANELQIIGRSLTGCMWN